MRIEKDIWEFLSKFDHEYGWMYKINNFVKPMLKNHQFPFWLVFQDYSGGLFLNFISSDFVFLGFDFIETSVLTRNCMKHFHIALVFQFLIDMIDSWRQVLGINPFLVNIFIICCLKTPENQSFFDVFRGYKMRTLTRIGLRVSNR